MKRQVGIEFQPWDGSFNHRMGGFPILRQPRSSNQLLNREIEKTRGSQFWPPRLQETTMGSISRAGWKHPKKCHRKWDQPWEFQQGKFPQHVESHKNQGEVAASSHGTRCLRDFLTLKLPVQRKCWTKCDWQMSGFCRAWSTSGEDSNIPQHSHF